MAMTDTLSLRIEMQLNDFTLKATITAGNEILVLHGPSGCGKTTILKCIAGLVKPKEGIIRLNGRTLYSSDTSIDTSARLRKVGLIFQDYALFPHMTVEKNVRYGLMVKRNVPNNKVRHILDTMRLLHLKDRFPSQLSGGEKQRVAVARALMIEPEILLLDEPLSALDADIRLELQSELKAIQRMWNIPFILVTHDREEAERLGDSYVRLEINEGERRFIHTRDNTAHDAKLLVF
ncbi:MAG TPA: ATP-binding cassette domain-containing protein [Anaerolineae bacterium]|nr:ATP-binding cassette domain-containing protein [Anaerolineae bacterium]